MRRPVLRLCSVEGCGANAEAQRAEFCRVHRYRVERYGSPDDPRAPKLCRVCGDRFMPNRADASTCFEPACKAAAKSIATALSDARRGGRVRRPRRVKAVVPSVPLEVFTRSDVGERDGWRCCRCGGVVDRALQWPDPDSLTLDLVDPFGARSFSNCRVAHLRCVDDVAA